MPVQYAGIREEHVAVRRSAGVFDVSHMGEVETTGPDAEAFLQHVLSNDVSKVAEGGAQYSVLCREDGGVLDDLFTYRLPGGRFLTVTNASNHERDLEWMRAHARRLRRRAARPARRPTRCSPSRGPRRAGSSRRSPTRELPGRFKTATLTVAGAPGCSSAAPATRARTASSCSSPPTHAGAVWDAVVAGGATPAGLGARDTLRLEVCFHLYGNDLME